MGRRRTRQSGFEQAIEAFARLPWRWCLALAPISYIGFSQLAQIAPPEALTMEGLASVVRVQAVRAAGMLLQYIAPLILTFAALISWLGQRHRRQLLAETESRTSRAPLQQLTWREFEQLVGAHFERQGYTVSFTPDGADGGVDVVARKGRETFLIQCKQWRATQVGVSVVRELFGVMSARGASGAFVVSIGAFTHDAREFASGRNIELVDAHLLLRASSTSSTVDAVCPKCGQPMLRRLAKQGPNRGKAFFGCSSYPRCRGTLPAD